MPPAESSKLTGPTEPAIELKVTKYEVDGGVATLTLNRPHRRNAWTGRMHHELRWLLQQANEDPVVRVVVITGEGRDFCVGADTAALEGHSERGGYDDGLPEQVPQPGYGVSGDGVGEVFDQNFAFIMALDVVVIAAVNGAAAGVGFVLACYCDLRFAVADAKLTTAHGPLGLPAEYGLSWVLPRLVGLGRANDLLLSSRKFLAGDIADWGLFNQIVPGDSASVPNAAVPNAAVPNAAVPNAAVPDSTVLDAAKSYAHELVRRVAPGSLATTKRQIYLDLHRDVGTAVVDSDRLLAEMMREDDYREGVSALVERRDPKWSGT